jgi:hypothetical protein
MHFTQVNQIDPDPDDELRGWHEMQAEDLQKQAENEPFHRCPIDMPPCPVCEEFYDNEVE